MKFGLVHGAVLVVALLAGTAATSMAADEIRSGKWQFTTQMQTAGAPQAQARSGGDTGITLTACIDPANPVPAEAQQGNLQCKRDSVERHGSTVSWSTTCTGPQGPPIRSAGAARYTGDSMEGTLTTRVIGPNGQPVDNPGRITGHYLGPCGAR
jgi:uncharacterized protein DUF3617